MAAAKRDLTDTRVQGRPVRQRDLGITGPDDVLTIDEVARRLHVPKATLYGWRYKGTGPRSHKLGKHLRYRWSDVLSWFDALD